MKLKKQIKPEILNYLKSTVKNKYYTTYKKILKSLNEKEHYRNLTMDEVDTINLFLADRFKPKNKTEFLFGDYLLKK